MVANLANLSELSKLLSVKSDTCESILQFVGKFNLDRTLSRHRIKKLRGVAIA
ncbi:hypothetical protein [Prevotella disiens]|uniref:hypothetical protein n=1 Tax=Prevotella disiens TaxID=28130 RepID=UPI00031B1586|nr:hypothetical protein [Prevotella disiens]